jgi:hypothetical protein
MCRLPGNKTPGGAGTHTGHTGHADAQRHTDQSHNQAGYPVHVYDELVVTASV